MSPGHRGRGTCPGPGPGAPLTLHELQHPGWLGPEIGPASDPCHAITEAQVRADAWWVAEVAAKVTRGQASGQRPLTDLTVRPA